MSRHLFSFMTIIALLVSAGCTKSISTPATPEVPPWLTEAVNPPVIPNPKTATQRDIARFIVQQRAALQTCNAQLSTIKNWSKNWTSQTKPE